MGAHLYPATKAPCMRSRRLLVPAWKLKLLIRGGGPMVRGTRMRGSQTTRYKRLDQRYLCELLSRLHASVCLLHGTAKDILLWCVYHSTWHPPAPRPAYRKQRNGQVEHRPCKVILRGERRQHAAHPASATEKLGRGSKAPGRASKKCPTCMNSISSQIVPPKLPIKNTATDIAAQ